SLTDLEFRNGDNEPAAPKANIAHLRNDFFTQIPRQDQHKIGLGLGDRSRVVNRYARPRKEVVLLVRAPIDGEIEELRSNSTIVQQCVAFGRRTVTSDAPAGALGAD